MSSLLTNHGAYAALAALRTIGREAAIVERAFSTGRRIATARDNAALWGVAATMRSDVAAHKTVTQSLSIASATLAVARDGAETVLTLLDKVKAKVTAAQQEGVDRTKIQSDVDSLRRQIGAVLDAAQFNGANLLKSAAPVSFLGMVSRSADGVPDVHFIALAGVDLSMTGGAGAPSEPPPPDAPRFESTGNLTMTTGSGVGPTAMTFSGLAAVDGYVRFDFDGMTDIEIVVDDDFDDNYTLDSTLNPVVFDNWGRASADLLNLEFQSKSSNSTATWNDATDTLELYDPDGGVITNLQDNTPLDIALTPSPPISINLSGVSSGGNLEFYYAGTPIDIHIAAGTSPTGGQSVNFDIGMANMVLGINSLLANDLVDATASWHVVNDTLSFVSNSGEPGHVITNFVNTTGLTATFDTGTVSTPNTGRIDLYGHDVVAGNAYTVQIASASLTVEATAGQTINDIMDALRAGIDGAPITDGWTQIAVQHAADPADPAQKASIFLTADGAYALSVSATPAGSPDTPAEGGGGGGLAALADFDMTDAASRAAALTQIETLIATVTDATSRLGSEEARVAIQSDAVSKFTRHLVEGIGALVDADMEESSARLKALQVRRGLALEALSIANQAPRALIGLFKTRAA